MENQDHNQTSPSPREPWDADFYQTGSTNPPPNHRGLVALLLICGIFLVGLVAVVNRVNTNLMQNLLEMAPKDILPFSLHDRSETEATENTDATALSATLPGADAQVELRPSPQSVDTPSQEGGLPLQDIYEKCIDSTVSVICTRSDGTAAGSGVVLSRDGYLITNCYLVEAARDIQVLLTDGRSFTAQLIGTDAFTDLAVLYVAANDLTPAEFGSPDALRVGDTVVAIGDPLGVTLRGSMTNGIVSAINRDIMAGNRSITLIQSNAALNAGNSGGPLINCYGQVIGINTAKIGDYVSSADVEGLGFAISSATMRDVVEQLVYQGYVSGRPSLGIAGTEVSTFYQYYYRLPAGVYVQGVAAGSDAAAKGLQVRDIILSINGNRVFSINDIHTILYSCQVGDTAEVVFYRAGQQFSVKITLEESKP